MGVCGSRETMLTEAPKGDAMTYSEYKGGQFFTCKPDGLQQIKYAISGVASEQGTPAITMIKLLADCAQKKGDKPAMKVERPLPPLGADNVPAPALPEEEWTTWTYKQYHEDVQSIAKGFIKYGFSCHDSVNVWGFNAPEWVIAAHAAVWAGGKVAGLYPTDTDETAGYKVVHSGGSIVVIEDKAKLEKLRAGLNKDGRCTKLKAIVAYGYEPQPGETLTVDGVATPVKVIGWQTLLEEGRAESDAEMQKRHESIQPGHACALIYTSGTTGEPKAVMLSHDNIIFETSTFTSMLRKYVGFGSAPEQERILSYLPLSHVAGCMVDMVSPLYMSSVFPCWTTLYFARNYDLKVGAIKDRLCVARPTLFLGVPLVWEKIADKIRAIGAANTGVTKALGDWSKGLALQNSQSKQLGCVLEEPVGLPLALGLLGKVKAGLGLQECKYGMTGAAPIRVDTLEYFGSLGLTINEVYGMSECTGACTVSNPHCFQWGSCGYEAEGVEVRAFKVDEKDLSKKTECPKSPSLDDAAEEYQGELCYRGRNIMMGYMCQPLLGPDHEKEVAQKTADAIDKDGWLHSGDKGMVTTLGMVKITGRYKELIIGEGGENIAPVPIEDHVKKMCDGIAEIMMIGDKRKYNVALVTLKAVGATGEVPGTDKLDAGAKRLNPAVTTIGEAMKDKAWIDALTAAITSANNNGKVCFNNAAKIQKFSILPTNFSEQGGELTPTKKLKRAVVQKMHAAFVDKMYSSKEVYVEYTP